MKILLLSTAITLFLSFSCSNKMDQLDQNQRPNIIIIMADDLGFETVGANGGTSYRTPAIDAMATRGVRFDHCYAQPLCTPSRVKLMTGISNVRNYVEFGILDTSQTTFGHLFKEAGYKTGIIGKWQLGKDPRSPQWAGFDSHCLWQVTGGRIDSTGRDTRFSKPVLQVDGNQKTFSDSDFGPAVVSDYGLDFIERNHRDGEPFFLYYPMILTHCPFSPTPDSPEWMQDDTTIMVYKGQPHYFEDMVLTMDKIIGKINDKLVELGIAENTLVLFTGDNGTDVPIVSMCNGTEIAGAKGESTDAGTRVPLIVQWPSQIHPGSVCRDLVDLSDFLPTICEAARVSIPESPRLDGVSFFPQLIGQPGSPRTWIYNWYSRSGDVGKASVFARTRRYKLYETGEFYNVTNDALELSPIESADFSAEEEQEYRTLQDVLDEYRDRRLEEIVVVE